MAGFKCLNISDKIEGLAQNPDFPALCKIFDLAVNL